MGFCCTYYVAISQRRKSVAIKLQLLQFQDIVLILKLLTRRFQGALLKCKNRSRFLPFVTSCGVFLFGFFCPRLNLSVMNTWPINYRENIIKKRSIKIAILLKCLTDCASKEGLFFVYVARIISQAAFLVVALDFS